MIQTINSKIKHISVFNQELANVIVPQKETGKFANKEDLKDTLKKREQLFKMG